MAKAPNSSSSDSHSGQASSMAELMARSSSHFNVFKKGDEVEGIVKKLTSKEILLDIGAKSDALVLEVEKSNMDNLLASLKVGSKVRAVIISPEAEEGFPVVSLRRQMDNMLFAEFDEAFKKNASVDVDVEEITRGGYFVRTQNGVNGFLPNSQVVEEHDLVGKTIPVKIIELDRSKKRVIFSQKANFYTTDTETLKKLFPKGEKLDAVISQVAPYGVFVTLKKGEDTVEGFIHISEISYDRVENLQSLYKKGDRVIASVIEIDAENRRVNLSVKALAADAFTASSEKFKKEDKVKGKVTSVNNRGVSVELEGVTGFIPSDKMPAGTEYKVGDMINAEVSDIDKKRRVIVLSPIVTKTFVGYR